MARWSTLAHHHGMAKQRKRRQRVDTLIDAHVWMRRDAGVVADHDDHARPSRGGCVNAPAEPTGAGGSSVPSIGYGASIGQTGLAMTAKLVR